MYSNHTDDGIEQHLCYNSCINQEVRVFLLASIVYEGKAC
jgi:hypothetical protein